MEKFGGSVDELAESPSPQDYYDLFLASQDVNTGRFEAFHADSPLLKDRFFLVAISRKET